MPPRLAAFLTLLRLLLSREQRLLGAVVLGVLEDVVGIGLGVAAPLLLKHLVDTLNTPVGVGPLTGEIGLFVLAWASPNLFSALKVAHTTTLVEGVSASLTQALVRRQAPRLVTGKDGDSGALAGLVERLPFTVQLILDGLVWRILPFALQTAASLIVLAGTLPGVYVVILIVTFTGYLFAGALGARRHRKSVEGAYRTTGALSALVGDILANARRVVLNGALELEIARLRGRSAERRKASEGLAGALVATTTLQFLILCAGLGLLLWIGARDVGARRVSLGAFVLVQAYAFRLAAPLGGLVMALHQSALALQTLVKVIDLGQPEARARLITPSPPRSDLGVRLEAVGFRYADGPSAIGDVSLALAPGALVVIAGANGSGKSTLAQLLAGVLQPLSGRILISGVDLATIDDERRRELVLYVPQRIGLFNRTLKDNALYPPGRQSEAQLLRRLQEWAFYDDGRAIDLDIQVGEHGERLSGGQVQKLELARLAGAHVPVLVLDESTSALDVSSELRALQVLRETSPQTLLVLITHKAHLAALADQVLYLSEGRLVGSGRHAALLGAYPSYRSLWENDDGPL